MAPRRARGAAVAVAGAIAASAALAGARAAGAEPPASATEERTVCEWVVEPRYVGSGAPKLEPQRGRRTETLPAPPAPPADLRPADGGRGTGIVVKSEPAASAAPKQWRAESAPPVDGRVSNALV